MIKKVRFVLNAMNAEEKLLSSERKFSPLPTECGEKNVYADLTDNHQSNRNAYLKFTRIVEVHDRLRSGIKSF